MEPKLNILQKIWRFRKLLVIEPLLICSILPFGLLSVTVSNFNLEKACRVNLEYEPTICQILLNKKQFKIDCNEIIVGDGGKSNSTGSIIVSLINSTVEPNVNKTVCKAEVESQKLVAFMNAIRAPISSFFPIIVILFAGGWSDRNGIRKPCMLFPMIGAVFSLTAHVISSIFFDQIPMEFDAIMEKVVPSIFGGHMLFHIGFYSYLTETISEKDRSFRFGIFTVIVNVMLLIGVSLSGIMYNSLGYIKTFILADVIFCVGIVYLIFFIPEVKREKKVTEVTNTQQIYTIDSNEISDVPTIPAETGKTSYTLTDPPKKKGFFADFFDPTSVYECIKVYTKKRDNKGRKFLILSTALTVLIAAPDDHDFLYLFTMKALRWNGDMYSAYLAYSMVIMMVGTFIMTTVFIKGFKLSDAIAGFLVSILSILSSLMKTFSNTTLIFYIAGTLNLFSHCKGIVINAIISEHIGKEEIGKVFAVLGITAALSRSAFPLFYSYVYTNTLETFPGAIYLISTVIMIPAAILFGIVHFLIKAQKNSQNEGSGKDEENNDIKNECKNNDEKNESKNNDVTNESKNYDEKNESKITIRNVSKHNDEENESKTDVPQI